MAREENTTKHLPEFLKQLDTLLANKNLTVAECTQISLQLKICELLSEIKYELTKRGTNMEMKN